MAFHCLSAHHLVLQLLQLFDQNNSFWSFYFYFLRIPVLQRTVTPTPLSGSFLIVVSWRFWEKLAPVGSFHLETPRLTGPITHRHQTPWSAWPRGVERLFSLPFAYLVLAERRGKLGLVPRVTSHAGMGL